jgi:hypothetical protein
MHLKRSIKNELNSSSSVASDRQALRLGSLAKEFSAMKSKIRWWVVVSAVMGIAVVSSGAVAQTKNNMERKRFSWQQVSHHPGSVSCIEAQANTTVHQACQRLGYQRAVTTPSSTPSLQCNNQNVPQGWGWELDLIGTCERAIGSGSN